MKEIPRRNSIQWRMHAVYLMALFCATVITWFMTDTHASFRELGLKSRIRSIHFLLSEYTHHRSRNGEWPKATDLYDTDFHLTTSDESTGVRIDTFSTMGQEMWLQFQLRNNGEITFEVSWAGPEFPSL